MYRLISTLAVMMAASGSQAAVTASPWGIEPMPAVEHVVSVESGSSYGLVFGSDSNVLLAQGPPRGAGGPPGGRPPGAGGPGGGPDYPPSGPRGPGRPGFYPGPRRPRPAPPPPGPAGIIPHILPLFLPPPRP